MAFFLSAIFFLYVLIDFSTFSLRFYKKYSPPTLDLALYYFHHFIRYLELFFPFTFMLSTIRILSSKQIHGEITPLLVAGISKKRLLMPFTASALLIASICYLNTQALLPKSIEYIDSFRASYSKKYAKLEKDTKIHTLSLKDGTTLVYQKKEGNTLKDVFWILSPHDIWHMKKLQIKEPMEGFFAHHLKREEDSFKKVESYKNHLFHEMEGPTSTQRKPFIPYENRTISELLKETRHFSTKSEKANLLTHLHSKFAMPLISFLILLALPPFLLNYTRKPKIFLLTLISIGSFLTFFTLIHSLTILGENQVLLPSLAIWLPFLTLSIFFGRKFIHNN